MVGQLVLIGVILTEYPAGDHRVCPLAEAPWLPPRAAGISPDLLIHHRGHKLFRGHSQCQGSGIERQDGAPCGRCGMALAVLDHCRMSRQK